MLGRSKKETGAVEKKQLVPGERIRKRRYWRKWALKKVDSG